MTKAEDLIDSFASTEMYFGNGNGLNKREYFSAMAMPVILKYCLENEIDNIFDTAANDSVRAADALINALNEKP